ncbi:cation transporting ATPase C-terminal domain-containing protein, partial [Candidatus Gracilibacteria bacterium]|nr:cation transporting ATPase C-terminal domain-containing protein [Candidatus Gracilibacteria bacterium]
LNGVMIVGLVTIMGFPLPILPLQILWINLATDAFPALALGQSKAHKGLMKVSPHPKEENMFKKFGDTIIVTVAIQTTLNLILYFYGLTEDSAMNIDTSILSIGSHARTLIFTEIVIFELFFAFVCKGKDNKNFFSYFSNGSLNLAVIFSLALQILIIYLPFAQTIFKTTPLSLKEWVIVTICSMSAFLIPIITEFLRKIFKK